MQTLPAGWYWTDHTSERHNLIASMLAELRLPDGAPAFRFSRVQETGGRVFAVFELPIDYPIGADLAQLMAPVSVAPHGADTRLSDVLDSPIVPDWKEAIPTPAEVAEGAGALGRGLGLLAVAGLGVALFLIVKRS